MSAALPVMSAGSHAWQILGPARSLPAFFWPSSLAVDARGDVYVLDRGNTRVVELSPSGDVLARFGSRGTGRGQLGGPPSGALYDQTYGPPGPGGLALDPTGNLDVADTWNHRIEKFSPSGRWLATLAADVLVKPVGLAIDRQGRISVADPGKHAIVRLDARGVVIDTWSGIPVRKIGGLDPWSVAVGPRGTVYAEMLGGFGFCTKTLCADGYVGALQAFSPDGRRARIVNTNVCAPIGTGGPCSLAVDRSGVVLWADPDVSGVSRISSAGKVLAAWGGGRLMAELVGTTSLALDRRGNLYVTNAGTHSVTEISPGGNVLRSWGTAGKQPGRFLAPRTVAVDARGNMAIFDAGNDRIQLLSPDGAVRATWRVQSGSNDPASPNILAMDSRDNVYWLTFQQRSMNCGISYGCFLPGGIVKYSSTGRVIARWAPRLHPFFAPIGIAIGPHDTVEVAESHDRVIVLSSTGRVTRHWSSAPRSTMLGSIAVDPRGQTYVGETPPEPSGTTQIEAFSGSGRPRGIWTNSALTVTTAGELAASPGGHVFVAQPGVNRILVLAPTGGVLARLGRGGFALGEFHEPAGVAVDGRGRIVVADTGNNRIQRG